jgi:hypothetical protein
MVAEKKVGWLAALILLSWTAVLVTVLSCYVNAKEAQGKEVKSSAKTTAKALPAPQQPIQKASGLDDPIQTKDPVMGSPTGPQKLLGEQRQSVDPTLAAELKKTGPNWESWRVVAIFYALTLIVFFLIFLLRYKPIDDWLGKHDLKGAKPFLSMVIGAGASFFAVWTKTEAWLPSFIFGLLGVPIGLSSVGLHQFLTRGNKK